VILDAEDLARGAKVSVLVEIGQEDAVESCDKSVASDVEFSPVK
jgi:hypothetical protein